MSMENQKIRALARSLFTACAIEIEKEGETAEEVKEWLKSPQALFWMEAASAGMPRRLSH